MKKEQFFNETHRVSKSLTNINDHIHQTVEVLERLLKPEAVPVEITEWAVRDGRIYIAFASSVMIDGVVDHSAVLTALFPSCRIDGNVIEIESSELL